MNQARVTTEDLHRALHSEIRNLRSEADWTKWLDASVALGNFSFRNLVLITLQMPYASQVARADAWKRLGRIVAEKQKRRSIRILAQKVVYDGGFRVGSVWDITQTEGSAVPKQLHHASARGVIPPGMWEALEHEVSLAGFTLVEGNTGARDVDGFTNYSTRTVVIRNGLDDVSAVGRLAHEVAHLRMHDPNDVKWAGTIMCRSIREVEAESVAYILLAHYGVSIGGSSFPYVAQWAATIDRQEPEKVVERTGSRVVFVARKLIESTERHVRTGGTHRIRTATLDSQAADWSSLRQETARRGPAL
jgi:hypothetical protein